jgi:hypothetical protein
MLLNKAAIKANIFPIRKLYSSYFPPNIKAGLIISIVPLRDTKIHNISFQLYRSPKNIHPIKPKFIINITKNK